ncbi:hypothetical protein B0H13DRAFT_1661112, partial [Mycena leptocephala]
MITHGSVDTPLVSSDEIAAESQIYHARQISQLISWIKEQFALLRDLLTGENKVRFPARRGTWQHIILLSDVNFDAVDFPDDSPFRHHCANNAQIWKLYMDLANVFDKNLADLFNSDLDPLLIFAGLFSAILSAFLIEIRKGLQEDLQSITNGLLVVLIQGQHNVTAPAMPSLSTFVPSASTRWVNGLWFTSLIFSLVSALGASVAKGWVTQFSSTVSGSSWPDASLHCQRFRGLERWHLKLIIQFLPILIHIAFFLFAAGLIILLF